MAGRLIGEIQARGHPAQTLPPGVFEVGIVLYDPADRGKGYGMEAVALLTGWLFEQAGAARVQASTAVGNLPMRRVLERLGFACEGVMRAFMPEGARRSDYALYAVTKSDWPGAVRWARRRLVGRPGRRVRESSRTTRTDRALGAPVVVKAKDPVPHRQSLRPSRSIKHSEDLDQARRRPGRDHRWAAGGRQRCRQRRNQQDSVSVGSSDAGGDGPRVVVGNGSGLDSETLQGNTDTNTPVNTCGNPVGGGGVVTGAQCRNRQDHLAVGHAG